MLLDLTRLTPLRIVSDLNLKIVRICKNASKEDKTDDILNIIDAGPSELAEGLSQRAALLG